jgi:hypothetical protein
MKAEAVAERTANPVLAIPAHAMGAAMMAASDVGLDAFEFYVLGRGGTMGDDVEADVITAAISWCEPSWVRAHYESGLEKTTMRAATHAWAQKVDSWAETGLSEDLPLERLAELLGRCIQSATSVGAPIFAGWRRLPEPESPSSLLMHRLYAIRELRAGLHAGAVRAAALLPLEALLIRTPALASGWGWPDPQPEVSHLADRWLLAEEGTNRALGRMFECFSESEGSELCDGIDAVLEHVGVLWWFDEGSPTIRFDLQPMDSAAS